MTRTQTKPFAWSFSVLQSFETCPKKHWHLRVKRDVKEGTHPAAAYGEQVHEALEARLKRGTQLPLGMRHLESTAARLADGPGTLYTEQELAINKNFDPTGYFDADVWLRGKVDAAIVQGEHAAVFDFKTGKRKDNYDQLALMAGLFMCHEPQLQRVTAAFLWLKDKTVSTQTYHRKDIAELWSGFLPRVRRLEEAFKTTSWPAKQNGLCRKHCPVTTCVYHGQ